MTTILRAADAPRFDVPGVTFVGMAAPSRGSADVCTWKIEVAAGHVSDQAHTLDRDEVFLVLSGSLRLTPSGALLGPGDAAVVPAGQPIAVANPGAEPATAVVAIAAGFAATLADGTPFGTPPWAR
jgi:mannose-6-phosphate isomerase-like protein (cupin superfamily)